MGAEPATGATSVTIFRVFEYCQNISFSAELVTWNRYAATRAKLDAVTTAAAAIRINNYLSDCHIDLSPPVFSHFIRDKK